MTKNVVKKEETVLNEALVTLFAKLDEAIDDVENGRILSEEELWEELELA